MHSATILVVDDDPTLLAMLAWLLKEQGYAVATAGSADEMFAELKHLGPDLLLLDIMMPEVDGIEILRRLKMGERWRDVPVLMLTALPPDDAAVQTFGLGASDFIRKPFRVRELLARIEAHLRAKSEREETLEALRQTEAELVRARDEAESRRQLVDILHEVTGQLSQDEIYRVLARRVARALSVSRCSVILASPEDRVGTVAAAFEDPSMPGLQVQLDMYPEIRTALNEGVAVLIEDARTNPIYEEVRRNWPTDGRELPVYSAIAIPFRLEGERTGVFFIRTAADELPLTKDDVEFAETVIRAAVSALRRAQLIETARADRDRLEELAITDPLTHLLNRRALLDRLASELDRARRYGTLVTLLMLDVDHFKTVNDTFGHLVGDEVLREVAATLQREVRTVDVVARYGGEEFAIVLPETGPEGGLVFAERIRDRFEETAFPVEGGEPVHLTVSIGLGSFPSKGTDSAEDLIARADEALYRAKADGRNRVRT